MTPTTVTPCVTCEHTTPHTSAGLGVCDTPDCGCDGPTSGQPNTRFLARKAEIDARNAVRKHLPEYVTVTAVFDYSTMTVTLPFPDFDLTDWERGAVDLETFEDDVTGMLTNEGVDREYNDLVIDGASLEDAFTSLMEESVIAAGREHAPLTSDAAELIYARSGYGDVIAYADSITAFPIEWKFCKECDRDMPVDPQTGDACLSCGSSI